MNASIPQTRVGVIGCGNIARGAYLPNLKNFPHLSLAACADLNVEAARACVRDLGVPRALSVESLIADPDVDVVLNLTVPQAHVDIDLACLEAGKHVFSEKPFALTRDDARRITREAVARNRRVGCAPDTVLGAGVQTCRRLVDAGEVGRPVAFTASMICGGHESWHPSPEFYYLKGGGPLFDMGPYYLHALVTLLGPVARVCAATRITFPRRTITSQPKAGKLLPVEVPTHVTAVLEFASGPIGTFTMSFDVRGGHNQPLIEIYGEDGSLSVPDPNGFGGPVKLRRAGNTDWREIPLQLPEHPGGRGLGLADMAAALHTGRLHRANDAIALHCTDIMESIHESAEQGHRLDLSTTCERPEPMPVAGPAALWS